MPMSYRNDVPPPRHLRALKAPSRAVEAFDKLGFFCAFLLGAAGIVSLKFLNVPQVLVTAFPVTIMATYGGVIMLSPRLRLRADQAGDNIYYLGFLFTLVSLSFALYKFSPDEGAAQIISSFGIALATTIVGLMLRVVFNQMRQDPVEVERETRLELAEAGTRVRIELDQVALEMKDFRRGIQQSMVEAFLELREAVTQIVKNSTDHLQASVAEVSEGLGAAFQGLNDQALRFGTAAEAMVAAFERQTESLGKLTSGATTLDDQIETLMKVSTEAQRGLSALVKKTEEMKALQAATREATSATQSLIAGQAQALSRIAQTTDSVTQLLTKAASAWEHEAAEAVRVLSRQTEAGNDLIRQELERLRSGQAEALRAFNGVLGETVEIVRSHSHALAQELATSRGYTRQVHSALVDMTGELIRHVSTSNGGSREQPEQTVEPDQL